jgi:hypothetical protein
MPPQGPSFGGYNDPMQTQGGFGMPPQGPSFGGYNDPMQAQGGFGMPGQMPQGGFGMPSPGFGGYNDPMQAQGGFGGGITQGGFGMPGPSQGGFGPVDQQPPQGGFGLQGMPFGGLSNPGAGSNPGNPFNNGIYNPYQMPQGPIFNELKLENNLLKKSPSDDDSYVNYSDLNKGKVSQNDMNKYVSQKEEKPVPRVDLNLETGAKDDDLKDYDE